MTDHGNRNLRLDLLALGLLAVVVFLRSPCSRIVRPILSSIWWHR